MGYGIQKNMEYQANFKRRKTNLRKILGLRTQSTAGEKRTNRKFTIIKKKLE